MSRHASSSPPAAAPPNQTLQRALQERSDSAHARKRLHHLTKVAVQRAYKLLAESRCLVPVVDTRGCGYTRRLDFSSLLENAPSPAPPSSSSKKRALPMDSNGLRLSVAARIQTLLTRWRADSSVEWRARVASVVPIFEGVLQKQAKSDEELANPRLLEAHLLTVLRHFEAGNGPFLLQGSSPPYPAQECHLPNSPLDRFSQSFSRLSGQSASENRAARDTISMETVQTFASSSSPISVEASIDTSQNVCSTEASTNKRAEPAINKIAKKVASVFTKERSGKSVCFKEGHENTEAVQRADMDMDAAEDIAGKVETMNDRLPCNSSGNNVCHTDGRMRQTLRGMLELNMFNRGSSIELNEESDLSSDHTIIAETSGGGGMLDDLLISEMERPSTTHSSSWVQIFHTDNGQGRNWAGISVSQTHMPSSLSRPTPPPPPSTVVLPPRTGTFYSPSPSVPPTSASAPSRSRIPPWTPYQAAFSAIPPPSSLSSSSPSQEPTQASNARHKPLSSSLAWQHAPPSTSPDKPSVDQNHLICKSGGRRDHRTASMLLHDAKQAMGAAARLTSDNSIIHAAPQARRCIEIGESSSGPSVTSSPSEASNEEASKAQVKGVRLPLRSFLADKEDHTGYPSSYKEGGPWDTWEETTEELDGMCCVCMVGFKGAAFVPCGHTFCRKCSRELWRGRGTCPLCNRFIREILDIY